jgi:raffinose/stachyose/melibiose transport system substrate-binding protein
VFPAIPSDRWKTAVGAALLEYAQGTAGWDAVETAFVDGWAAEKNAAR